MHRVMIFFLVDHFDGDYFQFSTFLNNAERAKDHYHHAGL